MSAVPPLSDRPVPATDWLLLLGLSVLWAGSFLFYKLLAPLLAPTTLVLGRVGIGAICLGGVLWWRGALPRLTGALCGWFLVLGGLNCALPFILFAWSEHHLSSGTAALLNAPTPVATALAAHFMTRDERLTLRTLSGAALALGGVLVLVLPAAGVGGPGALIGELACLVATACYAVGGVLARRVRGVAPLQIAFGQLLGATLWTLPVAMLFGHPGQLLALPARGWLALLGIALLSTALAYLLYFRILVRSGATRAALVTFLVPVSALLLGFVLLGEVPSPRAAPAVLLIGLGLAVIDGGLLRLLRVRVRLPERSRP